MTPAAVIIQLHDLLGRERRLVSPHFREPFKEIGMLHIKLQLIDLVAAQSVHCFFQIIQLQNPASGLIQIVASVRQIRLVRDFYTGKHWAALLYDLAEGLRSIKGPCSAAPGNNDLLFFYFKTVFLGGKFTVQGKKNVPFPRLSCHCVQGKPCKSPGAVLQNGSVNSSVFPDLRCNHDPALIAKVKAPLSVFNLFGFW